MAEGWSDEALAGDQIGLLARHRLIKPLLRQMIAAECASSIPVSEEERDKVLRDFMQEQRLKSDAELHTFLRLNLLRQEELQEQLLQASRLRRYVDEHYRSKAEARFLQRKNELDRVVYSLLRLEDPGLARELFLRINEGESDFAELAAAFEFLRNHRDAARGILATSIQRGGLTALTIVGLLLERNTFNSPTDTEAGLAGVSRAIAFAGVGLVVGAFVAPIGVSKVGRHNWIRLMAFLSAVTPILVGVIGSQASLYIAAFFVAASGQSMKVTNDALIQSKINDDFRGRTFALYDMTVNVAIVSGALLAALATPNSGKTMLVPVAISIVYLLNAFVLLRKSKFSGLSTI